MSLSLPNYIEVNRQLITDRRSIMQKFNHYFVGIASNLKENKPPSDFKDYSSFMKNRFESSMFFDEIESNEIDSITHNLNPNKSSDMSPRVLKIFRNTLSPTFAVLFNNCMYASIFPGVLKIARVIPLHKSGDWNDIANYRPTSLLPVFSKIFEKLILCRVERFLDMKLFAISSLVSVNDTLPCMLLTLLKLKFLQVLTIIRLSLVSF